MNVLNMRLNWRGAVSWPLPHSGHSVRRWPQWRQASPAGIWNLLPLVASQKCVHGSSSIWSARNRRLHSRQSTIGSVKLSTWPLAFHTVACMRMDASSPTMSPRCWTKSRHHTRLMLFFSSTPSGP